MKRLLFLVLTLQVLYVEAKKSHKKFKKFIKKGKKQDDAAAEPVVTYAGFKGTTVPAPIADCNDVMLVDGQIILDDKHVLTETPMHL